MIGEPGSAGRADAQPEFNLLRWRPAIRGGEDDLTVMDENGLEEEEDPEPGLPRYFLPTGDRWASAERINSAAPVSSVDTASDPPLAT